MTTSLDGLPNRPLTTQEILQKSFNGETLALKMDLGDVLPPSPDSSFNKYDIDFEHWDDGSFKQGQPKRAIYLETGTTTVVATLDIDYEQLSNGEVVILSTVWS